MGWGFYKDELFFTWESPCGKAYDCLAVWALFYLQFKILIEERLKKASLCQGPFWGAFAIFAAVSVL